MSSYFKNDHRARTPRGDGQIIRTRWLPRAQLVAQAHRLQQAPQKPPRQWRLPWRRLLWELLEFALLGALLSSAVLLF